ncbi:MAG TPA: ABC transporter substrate-binding protein [Acidimicrobiia bacterium]|jgi:branched-chain amino acid transport system substrate-binding protein
MQRPWKWGLRAFALASALGLATGGLLATSATAQSGGTPGVTAKAITLGYISSETGVAASASEGSAAGCKARVGAENAKGGVNGRTIKLEEIDDKSSANLNSAKDLVENRDAFIVINDSAFAFQTYRYLKDAGVPMLGGGFDGSYYFEEGNENIVSAYGDGTPVPGLAYDNTTKVMKQLGAKSVGAVGYGISPSSSESAKANETYAAKAQGLDSGYLNTAVDFGTTDVAPIVLGIKNAGADGLYLPLDANTNVAIIQGLQQNNVDMKAIVSATGYGQAILDQPAGKTLTSTDVFATAYRPVELGGNAVKALQQNLKKYADFTGVPGFGEYTGYVSCDLAIVGLQAAGKNPTRQGWVDGIRTTNGGIYDNAGLTCSPRNFSTANFGKVATETCGWYVVVKDGKWKVLFGGKPVKGKLVGDPALIKQYQSSAGTGVTTTSAAPAS